SSMASHEFTWKGAAGTAVVMVLMSLPAVAMTHETHLDPLFQAAADSVEQAIVHALFYAETVTGRDGHTRRALTELL
ncbi:P1 family peptidase, partial [Ralstonia pseudosolanacearum]|uniref:P1 family peptidase n=1 Tax=Ralstonia pseudosolanacearum TaxID=1310165 RepID=UPI003CF643EF